MSRYLLTVIAGLAESEKENIREAAQRNGLTALFCETPKEAAELLPEAEIIFSPYGELAKDAPALKWLCTSSAGVNQFLNKEVFLSGQAALSNSSGAYGVTIAERTKILKAEEQKIQKQEDI